ncbi:MFS transporter [Arthrobacter frigidicola]|nr:MFS transporter [Arthrobacter frigidicola]
MPGGPGPRIASERYWGPDFETIGSPLSVSPPRVAAAAPFPYAGLLALAGVGFVAVTGELLPTGLLPQMARDLGVGLSTAGYLVTIFAGTVVVATTPLAALTRRLPRKQLLVVIMFLIAAANLAAALAPTYEFLVAARIFGGLALGLCWAVVAAYPAHLVPAQQLGKSVAFTSGGVTAAFVLGVPVATAVGNAFSWRVAFAAIAVVAVLLAGILIALLPPIRHLVERTAGDEPAPRRDPSLTPVLLLCVLILVLLAGQNAYYTYIASWLTEVSSFGMGSVALILFLYGGAGIIGLAAAGYAADHFPRRGFAAAVLIVIAAVSTLAAAAGNTGVVLAAIVVWGAAFGGLPAMIQTRMLRTASARIRDLSAALQATAFNIGIGSGALLGGLLLDTVGLTALPVALIVLLGAVLVLSLAIDATSGRRERLRLKAG